MPQVPIEADYLVKKACHAVCKQYPHLANDLPVTRYNYAGRILAAELMETKGALELAEKWILDVTDGSVTPSEKAMLATIRAALEGKDWTL